MKHITNHSTPTSSHAKNNEIFYYSLLSSSSSPATFVVVVPTDYMLHTYPFPPLHSTLYTINNIQSHIISLRSIMCPLYEPSTSFLHSNVRYVQVPLFVHCTTTTGFHRCRPTFPQDTVNPHVHLQHNLNNMEKV